MAKQSFTWKYLAVHPSERNPDGSAVRVEGVMKAANADMVRSMLVAERGLDPVSIEPKKAVGGSETSIAKLTGGSSSVKDLALAYRQMATLVKNSVSLPEAVAAVSEGSKEVVIREALGEISHDLLDGVPLDESMAKHPKIFNEIDVQLVRSAVTTGNVAETLERIAVMKESQSLIRRKIRKALMMPTITILAAVGAGIFLAIAMVPDMAAIILQIDPEGELPPATKALLAFSDKAAIILPALLFLVVGLIALNRRVLSYNEQWLVFRSKVALRTPVLGKLSRLSHMASLSRGLEMMLSAGVLQSEALKILSPTMSNRMFRVSVEEMATATLEGNRLSNVMMNHSDLYDFVFTKMVSTGEKAGALDEMMRNVADTMEGEVEDMTDNMATIINPLATLVAGGFLIALLAGVFGPMLTIAEIS